MNQDKIKALAMELYKNEEVAIELANVIFGIRDGDYEPEKFEFEFVKDKTYFISSASIGSIYSGTAETHLNHGRYRKTKEGAELSLKRNQRANRLEMLTEYLGGLREFVNDRDSWYIFFSIEDDCWDFGYSVYSYHPDSVYMTREVAKQVCELLNSGAYSLDGE